MFWKCKTVYKIISKSAWCSTKLLINKRTHVIMTSIIPRLSDVAQWHCVQKHRQSKEWTGNAGKNANVADATSVIWPDMLYFGTL